MYVTYTCFILYIIEQLYNLIFIYYTFKKLVIFILLQFMRKKIHAFEL